MAASPELVAKIERLKKEKNASVLAHYYQEGNIQDIADACGDSYYLAKTGQESQADVILLAGVVFMAESVKILSPEKTVLVPDLRAGCSLVDESPLEKYLDWRRQHPEAICVTYINCSAEIKAISDVIVTSSSAEKIIQAIPPDRKILFGPDRNLGKYLAQKFNRPMEIWPGACQVHVLFNAKELHHLVTSHPDALVIAHPECEPNILDYADVIGSTSRLLEEVAHNKSVKKFIVATETGIFHQMKKLRPDAELIQAPTSEGCVCNDCPYMKLNSLEKVALALENLKPEVTVPDEVRAKALISLQRMMDITEGRQVSWPTRFQN